MSKHFECEVGSLGQDSECVVVVSGEVDLASATELETSLREALALSPSSIVLDLGALSFIDSSGLRVLVSISEEARSRQAKFALRHVPAHAQRVLDITGLSGLFDAS